MCLKHNLYSWQIRKVGCVVLLVLCFVARANIHTFAAQEMGTSAVDDKDNPSILFRKQFDAFPADKTIIKNKATLQLKNNKKAMRYRTRLTAIWNEALAPNFDGHYFAVDTIGCGSGCLVIFVINWNTGQISTPPRDESFAFEKNSRLIILDPFPRGYYVAPTFYDFDGTAFHEVQGD